jgi:hypothetical protein
MPDNTNSFLRDRVYPQTQEINKTATEMESLGK